MKEGEAIERADIERRLEYTGEQAGKTLIPTLAHTLRQPRNLPRLLRRISRKKIEQRLVVHLPPSPLVLHGLQDGAVVGLVAVVVEPDAAQVLDHVPVILGEWNVRQGAVS